MTEATEHTHTLKTIKKKNSGDSGGGNGLEKKKKKHIYLYIFSPSCLHLSLFKMLLH